MASLLFVLPSAAHAALALDVRAGAMVATDPVRATPAAELRGLWQIRPRFALSAAASGWVAPAFATQARAETALALSAVLSGPLSESLGWTMAAGPAVLLQQTPGESLAWKPGVALMPGLELASRRRSLAFVAGLSGWLAPDALRMGATAGVRYLF